MSETAAGYYAWNSDEKWRLMGVAMSLFTVRQRVWGDIRRYRAWREDGAEYGPEWQYYLPVTRAEWQQFKRQTSHEWAGE